MQQRSFRSTQGFSFRTYLFCNNKNEKLLGISLDEYCIIIYIENSTDYIIDFKKYIIALSGSWSQPANGLKDQ